jgi:hypothetical protein
LFHDFFAWIQEDLGKSGPDGLSWTNQLHESLNIWNVTEGTHVLTLMFFAGTIWLVDLRMMGLAFTNMPFSKLNDRILPITMASFAVMVVTGMISFIGRDPLMYYHDIWFRLKMTFLVIAALNIFWFHYQVQKSQAEWDALPSPPAKVKLSGAISLVSWLLIIVFGRFIAYDWYRCEKVPEGSFVYVVAECKQALSYLDGEGEATEEESTTDEAPAEESTTDPAAPEGEAPAEPAPAQPAPGQGG